VIIKNSSGVICPAAVFCNLEKKNGHGIKGVFFANLTWFFAWKNGKEESIL
jgi:hypothetical protein